MKSIRVRKIENYQLLAMAIMVLLLGVAYYLFSRQQDSTVFLSLLPDLSLGQNSIFFSRWFGWFPTFTHTSAFSLLSYLVLGRRHLLFSCLLWGGINALFELGQLLPTEITQLLPDICNLRFYLNHGTFDPLDLIACFVGAWIVWVLLRRQTFNDDKQQATID